MFNYGRITLFSLEKRLSKHKMTIFSKMFGLWPLWPPPGYAYDCFWCWIIPNHMLKIYITDAELAGHAHKLDVKLQSLCGSGFSLWCACLPNLTTLEWIDQQHFAKTKMGYTSLPSHWNAIIGIESYDCLILNMVILHDSIKTIPNRFLFVFFEKRTKIVSLKKNGLKTNKKNMWIVFFKPGLFQPWLPFNPFSWFSLDRTIWNKSCHYRFDWVCAPHLKYRSLVSTKLRITGIWICKN